MKLRRAGILFMLMMSITIFSIVPVHANTIHSVEISLDIHSDGSGTFREIWDISITNPDNTEWFIAKHNLDNMQILNLVVEEVLEDGSTLTFETLDAWIPDASRSEKAGRAGLLRANGGYEICWGFGELGRRKYIVTYTMTNLVKGYVGGDAMSFNFLSDTNGVGSLNIYINADGFSMVYPRTRVWVFGYEAFSEFVNGGIEIQGRGRFSRGDYAAVLLAFDPGLLSPVDRRNDTLHEIIQLNMEGSIWEQDHIPSSIRDLLSIVRSVFIIVMSFLPILLLGIVFSRVSGGRTRYNSEQYLVDRKPRPTRDSYEPYFVNRKPIEIDYCRDLPFGGNLCAAYARLYLAREVRESNIIGSILLVWLWMNQIDILSDEYGVFWKRKTVIQLHPINPYMPEHEAALYFMMLEAADPDGILRANKFKKWAKKNYRRISLWLIAYRNEGSRQLDKMREKRQLTGSGRELMARALGFKRYLEDFSIIDEREAQEVVLWEWYLVFAQLFGIASRVIKQFKRIYPVVFPQPDANISDILTVTSICNKFAGSMYSGYCSGERAARAAYNRENSSSGGSSSSGGGGYSSSSGGGGGASGGGGAGGR